MDNVAVIICLGRMSPDYFWVWGGSFIDGGVAGEVYDTLGQNYDFFHPRKSLSLSDMGKDEGSCFFACSAENSAACISLLLPKP